MKTLIAKLDEQIALTKQNMPTGGIISEHIARLVALQQARKITMDHIMEHAVIVEGEDVVYLGDLDNVDGVTVSEAVHLDDDTCVPHKNLTAHWRKLGLHYKFPACCIDQFCETKGPRGIYMKESPFHGSGFVPCLPCHEKTKDLTFEEGKVLLNLREDMKNDIT